MLAAFPSITEDEFLQACQAFEKSCQDKSLSETDWLYVGWHGENLTIKKSFRSSSDTPQQVDGLSEDGFIHIEHEEIDHLAFGRSVGSDEKEPLVEFTITLSPTYQVPVLWMSLRNLQQGGPHDIEAVYQYLVPSDNHPALTNIGVMGAISIANHPENDLPAFFIHPCNTHEALRDICPAEAISPKQYLIMWLGIVGPAVGLYIPSKLML